MPHLSPLRIRFEQCCGYGRLHEWWNQHSICLKDVWSLVKSQPDQLDGNESFRAKILPWDWKDRESNHHQCDTPVSKQSESIRLACYLPKRQRQVLEMLADGETTNEIAANLKISPKTVEKHRMELMRRTNLWSYPELTKLAIRLGLSTINV